MVPGASLLIKTRNYQQNWRTQASSGSAALIATFSGYYC